ncbi:efflux RND transporter periplasmic adaptor subunit [Erythrobacteraceae bacterium CFH 75059]|uniref:efflux RND transporter periplasmic adaptor subunit n=1 Tax=Qipengyuania thermophila TaxID=2509361 RepID=UPI0010224340|nr:efflux RND transporter periplasmic adaptor subunit [Qipengyuania thermophila]TCD06740.1 efflux RND transporter periplasmic adaptor subunit [Erythrobacteraceae bacterium CFH 75059]
MNYESRISVDPVGHPADPVADGAPVRRRRTLIIGAVLIGLVLAALAYYASRAGSAEAPAASEQVPSVTVVAPGRQTIEGEVNVTGTLAARRNLPVGVVGEGGRVVSVLVDAGDWVRQGQVLAVIDRSVQEQQARGAVAQIAVAQADARLAQENLERALQLVDRGFISRAEVDRLTATRDAANARVAVARAQADELRARNARLNIVAPAAGLVLQRQVEPGQTVSAGSGVLFSIAQNGELELLAQVGENELANLSVGLPVEVTPAGTTQAFTGQIWQLSPTIDPQTRLGTARVALRYDPALRPGGFATAVLRSGTVSAPVLPESALQSDGEGSYVYIVGDDNRVVRRNVRLGNVTRDGIIIAEGLAGTERVVLFAGGFLAPGDAVRPVRAAGARP